jgi:hypothetical protein
LRHGRLDKATQSVRRSRPIPKRTGGLV